MKTIIVKLLLEDAYPDAPFTVEYVKTVLETTFALERSKPYPRVRLIMMEVTGDGDATSIPE